jgi:hypothetical protein
VHTRAREWRLESRVGAAQLMAAAQRYAHARPWAAPLGGQVVVKDPTPNPTTGTVTVSAEGDPDRLLDSAFRAVLVVENGIGPLEALSC